MGKAHPLHRGRDGACVDHLHEHVGGHVIAIADHQAAVVKQRELRLVAQVLHDSGTLSGDSGARKPPALVEPDLAALGPAEQLDHDRDLENAGSREELVGMVGKRLSAFQVLGIDPQGAPESAGHPIDGGLKLDIRRGAGAVWRQGRQREHTDETKTVQREIKSQDGSASSRTMTFLRS